MGFSKIVVHMPYCWTLWWDPHVMLCVGSTPISPPVSVTFPLSIAFPRRLDFPMQISHL